MYLLLSYILPSELVILNPFVFHILKKGETSLMESVPDLQNSMYKVVDGYPCVRLLNLSGEIGCSSKLLNEQS